MRSLLTSFFALSFLACGAQSAGVGRTLALQDDAGVVALTWDGATARAWRGDKLVLETPALTWDAAMWSVDLPAYGTVSAPHYYDRVLTVTEVEALGACDWARTTEHVSCGWDARCDCEPSTRSAAVALAH